MVWDGAMPSDCVEGNGEKEGAKGCREVVDILTGEGNGSSLRRHRG